MAAGLAKTRQTDFSAGMFSSPTLERIPANGFADCHNALIDDTGGLYRRGGGATRSGDFTGVPPAVFLWDGTLTAPHFSGHYTVFQGTTGVLYRMDPTGPVALTLAGGDATPNAFANGAGRAAALQGRLYFPNGGYYDPQLGTWYGPLSPGSYPLTVANRLVNGVGNTVEFSPFPYAGTFDPTDFWEIPDGATITGMAGIRDSAVVFTDRGVWVISNMAMNLTDADGNIQQRLDLFSPDLNLWGKGAAGVVGYQGGLIVTARDGVWLLRLGAIGEVPPLELLSGPITKRYTDHVAANHVPGLAAVLRGHYLLPILNLVPPGGGDPVVVDFLVCRLDHLRRPWTAFSGFLPLGLTASSDGLSLLGGMPRNSPFSGSPNWAKLANLHYFKQYPLEPHFQGISFDVTTRDLLTGTLNENTVTRMRAGYRLDSTTIGAPSPTMVASYGGATEASTPTALTGAAPQTDGHLSTYPWPVSKRTRAARFKLALNDPSATAPGDSTTEAAVIESIEMYVRPTGRD